VQQSQQVLEWQNEARIETTRALILRALELRFRTPVPADLAAMVAASNDLDELSRWLDHAVTADNLDAFRAALRQAVASPAADSAGGGT
jgi:hypothetical protein